MDQESQKSLENIIVNELIRRNLTIATAESCTGGLLAKRITDQAGVSKIFSTGLITYSNASKTRLLNIPEMMLREHGAVSVETAKAMAQNVRTHYNSDLGLAITGIAGPDGGSEEKPVGLVYIALSSVEGSWVYIMRPTDHYKGRKWIRTRATTQALEMLHWYLFASPKGLSEIKMSFKPGTVIFN